ncbi:MAG: hypothetical protein R3B46_11900 [Phycisphaerales bacterium]|nr:hypothetical protein [Phycisphaerales bacterium]
MLRWVNRLALVIGLTACGAALGQPAMPDSPAPVVERTVTIRLVDPDGEPVAGWPMGLSTSYSTWRNQAWADTVDEQGRHPEVDFQFVPALSVSDEDGVIRASVEFFEGDWRFQIGLRPVSTKSEREQYPESTVERIRERNRQIGFAPSYSFQSSVDPALMIFEIRAESVVQVHATLVDHRGESARLWRIERGPRKGAINFDDVPDGEGLDEVLRQVKPVRGNRADQADDPAEDGRVEELNAIPGFDHVLMLGTGGTRCWLIAMEQIVLGADLGRFEYDAPAATGVLNVRLAPAYLDQESGRAVSSQHETTGRAFGVLRPTLLSTDGAYCQSFRVDATFDYRTRNQEMGFTEAGEGMTYVPPGEYYILDHLPFDAASHGMRFALLVELLRGNHPEPGELPTITVVEGVNPYVEIEMADCYNALKAWYDKRFSKVDVEGFE